MSKRTLVLKFPHNLVDKPITYKLAKDYDLQMNILKAKVTPKEEGSMVIRIEGVEEKLENGINYLKKSGVKVQPLIQDVELVEDKCTNCTYCVTLCPTQAFEVDKETMEIRLNKEKCIACGICVKACPYDAVELKIG